MKNPIVTQAKETVYNLYTLLQLVEDDKMTLKELSQKLGQPQTSLSHNIRNAFRVYCGKQISTIPQSMWNRMIKELKSPSERVLDDIFDKDKNEYYAYPNYDETVFWEVIKDTLSSEFYTIVAMASGYGYDEPMSFEQIGEVFKVSRQTPFHKYWSAIKRIRKANILYRIFCSDAITQISSVQSEVNAYSKELKEKQDKLESIVQLVNELNSEEIDEFIKVNFPTVHQQRLLAETINEKTMNSPISELNLSTRAEKCLTSNGIQTIAQLRDMDLNVLATYKNLGITTALEIAEVVHKLTTKR